MENPIIQELLDKTAGMADDAALSAKQVNEKLRKASAWEETNNPEHPMRYSFQAEADEFVNDIKASLTQPAGVNSIRKAQDRKSKSVMDSWLREHNPKFGKSLNLGAAFDPADTNSMDQLAVAFGGAFQKAGAQALINRIKAPVTTTGITTGTGLVPYALDDLAKVFVPFLYPLRQSTPRIVVGGTQYNYKVISALNPNTGFSFVTEASASQSGRAPALSVTTSQQTALFKLFGVENFLTVIEKFGTRSKIDGADFNADMLQYFLCLQAEMIEGDWTMLGANGGTGAAVLGAPGTPAAATNQFVGGSLTASTHYYIKVSALNLQGVKSGAHGNNGVADAVGESTVSAELNQQTASSGAGSQSIAITFTSVVGAVGYNIYVGVSSGAEEYNKTVYCTGTNTGTSATSANVVLITDVSTSTNTPNTADLTLDANAYAGLISIASNAISGQLNTPYVKDLLAAGFTGDNTTGVQEFDAAFHYWWDTYRLGPTVIWMNGYDAKAASKIILGSSAPVFRVDTGDGQQNIRGTIMANSQLNPYIGNGQGVEFRIHPYLPRGTVLFNCENLGPVYSMAGIPSPFYMLMGFDAMAFDFAFTGMKYENGVYEYGCPVAPFPGATGCIRNTGN